MQHLTYAAKNPGTWANTLKVCTIDDFADQQIGINTNNLAIAGARVGLLLLLIWTEQLFQELEQQVDS